MNLAFFPNTLKAAAEEEREACARLADIWANTQPLQKSDNPDVSRLIASIMSDTGRMIAQAIRARSEKI